MIYTIEYPGWEGLTCVHLEGPEVENWERFCWDLLKDVKAKNSRSTILIMKLKERGFKEIEPQNFTVL